MMAGNGVGNIGTRFPRLKLLSRYVNQHRPSRCAGPKWKRLLASSLVVLLFAMVAEFDDRLLSQTSKRAIGILADPLSLLSERSPGQRGAGTLFSIKGKPREHVLSTMRDRPPQVPEAVASIPIIPPQYDITLAENRLSGFQPFPAVGSQPGNPGFAPEGLLASGSSLPNPPARLSAAPPLETMAVPEPPSWTTVAGPLAIGLLVRQYVRKRRQA